MTLTDLVKAAERLNSAIKVADEAFDHYELNRLMLERDSLNAYASYLRPSTDVEVGCLQKRIVEYAKFISDIPTRETSRLEALEAIRRMSDALAEWINEQRQEKVAA
jgi:hypothetical protein